MSGGAHARGLLAALHDVNRLGLLSLDQWADLLPAAERARLLPRVGIAARSLETQLPDWVRDRLESAALRGTQYGRDVLVEVGHIRRALRGIVEPVLLKGAAYVAAGLPCGVGRVVQDVDILVDESVLPRVEAALVAHGWEFEQLAPYDQRYYREWMHELPPMRHRARRTMLDVHHRILPRTGRLHPPTERLLERSQVAGGLRVPAHTHLLLHAAAHLFQDGEIAGSLRDVVDIHDLVTSATAPDFALELAGEAAAMGLERPLYYSLRTAHRLLKTPVPQSLDAAAREWGPAPPIRRVMDSLVDRTVLDESAAASFALYLRANWLKMPPGLFARHLLSKLVRRSQRTP
jgi:hypothetical protein